MSAPFASFPGFALALALAVVLARPAPTAAADWSKLSAVSGTGMVIKDARRPGPFQSLQLDTRARVVVRQGERELVEVIAEGNIAPLIDAYIEQRRLHIGDRRPFRSSEATVVVTVRQLERLDAAGTVSVTARALDLPALALRLEGESAVWLDQASIGRLRAELGGSSTLRLSGAADEFAAQLGGSSVLRATELEARTVSLAGGGSSQAAVWALDALDLSLGGSAAVEFYGKVAPTLATGGTATLRHLGTIPTRP